MINRPSCWNAGDAVIIGTHFCKNASALVRPPGWPFTHGASWPSSHRFGVIRLKLAVVEIDCRSVVRLFRFTTCRPQSGESMIEWKYMNGLCRVAYWSPRGTAALGASADCVRWVVLSVG